MLILLFSLFLFCVYWAVLKSQFTNKDVTIAYLFICACHILLLYNLRDESLFDDLYSYKFFYNGLSETLDNAEEENANSRFEIGWFIINKLLKVSLVNYKILFLLCYLVILYTFFKTIYKYSSFVLMAVVLYFCTCFYNSIFVLRQWMAIGICLMSIPYILNRSIGKFIALTMLAVSFHYSAMIWLPSYFLFVLKINIKNLLGLLFVFFILYNSVITILEFLFNYIPAVDAYHDGDVDESGSLKPLLMTSFVLLFSLFSFGSVKSIKGVNKLALIMLLITFIMHLTSITGTEFTMISRLVLYYEVGILILLPNAISQIHNDFFRHSSVFLITFFYFLLFYRSIQYGFKLNISL